MKKKILSAAILMMCTLLMLACENEQSPKAQKIVLNEVAHSVFYAPMYAAIEKGYFKEEGLQVELVTGFGADKTMTAVLTGEADIGFMGSESTIYTYAQGAEDYVVNFAQLTQRAGNFLVAREPVEDFRWDMLEGKKVLGGRTGGMPEMVFEYILTKNGMDPEKDLNIDKSIDFGSTAAAFSGGQGDYTVEFEPYATYLEQEGKGYVVASLGEDSGYVPYTAFSARKSYLEQNKDTIEAFVRALQKGMDYVQKASPEEIAETIEKQFPETDHKALVSIIKRYKEQDTWKSDLIFEKEAFDLLQNILMDCGVLEERVPYEKLVERSFAEKAAKGEADKQ